MKNPSQQTPQSRAKEIWNSYRWGRFQEGGALDQPSIDQLLPYHSRWHCQELEGNYRQFLRYFIQRREEAWPRSISCGHYNFQKGLVQARRYERCPEELFKVDKRQKFFYQHLGNETLDLLVRLLDTKDEGLILLPKYWPDEFGEEDKLQQSHAERYKRYQREQLLRQGYDLEWIESHLKLCFPPNMGNPVFVFTSKLLDLEQELGKRQLKAMLREKIPRYPQEVQGQRSQVMENTPKILDKLYEVTMEYLKEKGVILK